ncbi:short chain dehydrogenase [Legionella bononiensis]|uniref:Short chain dehydrogenase n=1 Tax=Legionella bononiensis TaxID=2793102 RepID=A0ABS1W7S6_9GAMM|nr:short chain dehydrogenase [Legionella bononiensis]MBL7480076.1 short chain dehydrogenase [Legionella bononiensis]MBL7525409.1 short chain dehydrogenase [Legionella bononiensis]MBL7561593.1 short chain dehydrogenase [Legionella bononiensis]
MKIMVIGGTGLIGAAVVAELEPRHEVICVGHSSGDYTVNIEDPATIKKLYQKVGRIDAVVMTTGRVSFLGLSEMTASDFNVGLNSKLMGQVNCVLMGLEYMNDAGSFTLTSGILNHDPIAAGTSAAMVNGAIDGFVTAAAIEMPRGIRINAVSPTVVTEALDVYGPYFRGYEPVPVQRVAHAFSKSVEGLQTGKIYHAR